LPIWQKDVIILLKCFPGLEELLVTKGHCKLKNLKDQSKLLLRLIQQKGPITRNQIMDITKMKLTTLKRFMQPLLDEGFVIEADLAESTGGRPPVLYDVNPKTYYVIGIDISRTYTEVVITNLKMKIIDLYRFGPPFDPVNTVNQICSYIENKLHQLCIEKSMVIGVGVGTVGPLDRKKGIMLNPANFPSNMWVDVPIKDMLQQKLKLPTTVDNGANAAVLAEHLFGAGQNTDNISYFHCGMGIRTGTISSGNIIRAMNDYEDAFGHMVIDINGDLCHCQNRGCIETYCSIPSITKKFKESLKQSISGYVNKPYDEIDFLDICAAAEENDELAQAAITSAATIFGIGLANYINLVNPELVILSGPIVKHSALFYKIAVEMALKRKYVKNHGVSFSRGGNFKDNAIAVGAAVLLIEEILKNKNAKLLV